MLQPKPATHRQIVRLAQFGSLYRQSVPLAGSCAGRLCDIRRISSAAARHRLWCISNIGGPMPIPNLTTVDPHYVRKMADAINCQKPEVIQDRFGIGVKTWVKIR